eukprot:CAMPEP_0185619608 /NCGR_PEP_ID=MMETSP0436-20130131/51146_1 /TAXON_ID=626734 ORGANISM="Favella taraikaensis, Strain Fe Narragansett Bay" /NCGR_SAMPLE_ID=MMETSP0436 /ASSEMBLY_ACC=CAM_ASM_000390 /LENGTH=133 /DNA_ID=CAMNT_0028259229 /DNA_START=54 /DNA_END=454 /DNA_ORIENTATION=-
MPCCICMSAWYAYGVKFWSEQAIVKGTLEQGREAASRVVAGGRAEAGPDAAGDTAAPFLIHDNEHACLVAVTQGTLATTQTQISRVYELVIEVSGSTALSDDAKNDDHEDEDGERVIADPLVVIKETGSTSAL